MNKRQEIKGKTFDEERSLYNLKDAFVSDCKFTGERDGESPFKEARDVEIVNCFFDLRYAFWHVQHCKINNTTFSSLARAPFWYDNSINLENVESHAVKVFRECENVNIIKCSFESEEPFWRCSNINVKDTRLSGFYAFFECKYLTVSNLIFSGKYSFQYTKHLTIDNSELDTKDAFWHCDDVVIKNSTIKGEYIGWYSKNMTFINCRIESHQPFCYCNNITFIDCTMPSCDLAFENSTVAGNIIGEIESIKNPISCDLKVDKVNSLINDSPFHKASINIVKNK